MKFRFLFKLTFFLCTKIRWPVGALSHRERLYSNFVQHHCKSQCLTVKNDNFLSSSSKQNVIAQILSLFIFSKKIDVNSSKILVPGTALRKKYIKLFSRLPFTSDPATQSHFKFTSSILVNSEGFANNCTPAGNFFSVKLKTPIHSKSKIFFLMWC